MKYPPSLRLPILLWLALVGSSTGVFASHAPDIDPVANLNRQLIPRGHISTVQQIDDRVVMIHRVELHSYDLWVSDGTSGGTVRLRSLCPTGCPLEPRLVASTGTRAFFVAPDDQQRQQLWISDGTFAGTRPLTQLLGAGFPANRSTQSDFHWSDDLELLFFSLRQTGIANQLWISDGTPAGTQPLGEPSPTDSRFLFDSEGEVPGAVLFSARDEAGEEPWRSDGTVQGTRRLGDLAQGPLSSSPFFWARLGERTVFTAGDEDHGRELWITDGTPAGTRLVRDWTVGPEATNWRSVASGAGQAFFLVRTSESGLDLIRTDGTSGGTRRVGSFVLPPNTTLPLGFGQSLGSLHVFAAATEDLGLELWVSDGTSQGTLALGDLCPGACSSDPNRLFRAGDQLLFTADDGLLGRELWLTDGTPAGTRQVADLCPGSCSSNPRVMTALSNGRILVHAEDDSHGREIWSLGISGAPSPARSSDFVAPQPLFGTLGDTVGGTLFTAAELDDGLSLWATAGTPTSTRALQRLSDVTEAGSRPHGFVPWQGDVLFSASTPEQGHGLWRLAGDMATFVASLETGSRNTFRETLATAVVGDRIFVWSQSDGRRGEPGELWTTRGTTQSTRRLQENVGPVGDARNPPPVLNGKVFFFGTADNQGLWATDGVSTARLYDGRFFDDNAVVVFRNRLYFAAEVAGDFGLEQELWVTDGTPAGTRPFINLADEQASDPRHLTVFDSHLYFIAAGGVWRTDGTADGTIPVSSGQVSGELRELEAVAGRLLVFGVDDMGGTIWALDRGAVDRAELLGRARISGGRGTPVALATVGNVLFFVDENEQIWRTDATPAGTFPVDLLPVETALPVSLTGLPGHVLISAGTANPQDPSAWISDGTPAGTRLLSPLLRIGKDVLVSGSQALLAGDDGQTGLEVWSLGLNDATPPPPPPPPPTGRPPAPRNLRAEGTPISGVFLTWQDASSNETAFEIQSRRATGPIGFETVGFAPAGTESFQVDGLPSGQPHHFRVRALNGTDASDWGPEAVAAPVFVRHDCLPGLSSPQTLCLQKGRFEIRVLWHDPRSGNQGDAGSSGFDFSDDSGTFWFFDPTNVELVVKALDARTVNGFQWVFYGALSDVEYWITVTDTQSQTNVTYYNPPGEICGLGDVRAFPRPETPAAALSTDAATGSRPLREVVQTLDLGSAGTPCTPGPESLCLSKERYRVEVEWRDPRSGNTGHGFAIPGTADSGYFWFFDPANVELVVKVLDARVVNGHVWVFFGALTDVEYNVTVTDTATGGVKTYRNEPGNLCGQADVRAF